MLLHVSLRRFNRYRAPTLQQINFNRHYFWKTFTIEEHFESFLMVGGGLRTQVRGEKKQWGWTDAAIVEVLNTIVKNTLKKGLFWPPPAKESPPTLSKR
jgi:hypothetical protein